MNKTKNPKSPVYSGLKDMLASGFDTSFTSDASNQMVKLDQIEIGRQDRTEMEDSDQTLADLGESLLLAQIHNIFLRPNPPGSALPYYLVAGERRVRAARLKGIAELRAFVKPLTDDEMQRLQQQENEHRKNLTQYEEAQRLQKDLEELGSYEAVLERHKKVSAGKAWLSKRLSLLNLSPIAARLVKENISSDLEVIGDVRQIEKADPVAASKLVDELKVAEKGSNVRRKVAEVKKVVRPAATKAKPSPAKSATSKAKSTTPSELLAKAYTAVFEKGQSPKTAVENFSNDERADAQAWLQSHFEAGQKCKDLAKQLIAGFRQGQFATDGDGALNMIAFVHGATGKARFTLSDVLAGAKE